MSHITSIALILLAAFVGAEVFHRWGYPRIIGQLVIGLILGSRLFGNLFYAPEIIKAIEVFSEIGVIFLLLLTGFNVNISEFKKSKKESGIIAVTAALVPFVLGFVFALLMKWDVPTAVVLGATLAVTAEGTTAALLLELKKITSRVGTVMLETGIMDDVFEIIFLTIVLILSHQSSSQNIYLFPIKAVLFVGIAWLSLRYIPRLIKLVRKEKDDVSVFGVVIITGLILASISEFAGFGAIIGAFVAGFILQRSFTGMKVREHEAESLQLFTFAFIVPFFFLYIGINFDPSSIIERPLLTLAIVLIALIGKIAGTMLAKPWSSLSMKQLYAVGWGLNSRGVMELVIAQLAYSNNLISRDLYSAIVFMAVATTVIFPFVLRMMIKKQPDLLDA